MKSTLVIGATPRTDRYANMAIRSLINHKQPVIAFGREAGVVEGVTIETEWDENWDVETVTLYLGPRNQEMYYQPIIDLHPKRVIFNPGTENPEFFQQLRKANIEVEVACTLVLLSTNQY